jgi:RHS repeat-associated protein
MPSNGYFYTYLTNYSDQLVTVACPHGDNLTIRHKQGVLRAQYDYYPYGLPWDRVGSPYDETMSGTEFQTGEWGLAGLDLNYFAARYYDPILGRWHAPDPLEQCHSPYLAMLGDPANFIDPDGRAGIPFLQDFMKSDGGTFLLNLAGQVTFLGAMLSPLGSIGGTLSNIVSIGASLYSAGLGVKNLAEFTSEGSTKTYARYDFSADFSMMKSSRHAGMAFDVGSDEENIEGRVEIESEEQTTITATIYHSYYFDRYGTFLKREVKDNGDAVFIAENDATKFEEISFTGYRADFVKDYIALVCGEAGTRDDAAGIGTVILNRFDAKSSAEKVDDWWNDLGGKSQYDALSVTEPGHGFPDIQALTIDEILTNMPDSYEDRIKGALTALSNSSRGLINDWLGTPYFWEGISSYGSGNYFYDNSSTYTLISQAGGSYFFRYSSNHHRSKYNWP